MDECLGCDLTSGRLNLPGGRIYSTSHWVVEHCVGPLGVGTLIVKPFRHCTHFWELTEQETEQLGPLLRRAASTIRAILNPDQVYICQWSHAGWTPQHLHFVLQPAWNNQEDKHLRPGPFLQVDMFETNALPPIGEVEAFCEKAKELIQTWKAQAL